MCFSASASFIASGGLVAVSAATLRVAPRRRRFLALIPFAFAVQQALEGVQWLALHHGTTCSVAGYGFAFFAFVFWPVFFPAAVYVLDRPRRPRAKWFLALGIGVALCNLVVLIVEPLFVKAVSGTIVYDLGMNWIAMLVMTVLYVLAIHGSLLTSRILAFRWFGVMTLVAGVGAYIWFREGFSSIWCYVTAILSTMVFLYARMPHKRSAR